MRKIVLQKPQTGIFNLVVHKEQSPKDIMKNYFIAEIQGLYWTEKCLLKALPKIQEAAHTMELKEALEDHSSVTDDHVERFEQVFGMLKEPVQARKCEVMDGLIRQTNHVISKLMEVDIVRDAGIIMMIKKMQHYQIAVYESLLHLAKILGEGLVAGILLRSFTEDKKALEVFSRLAEYHVSDSALLESENELEDVE